MLYIAVSGVSLVLCSGSFNVLRFVLLMVGFVVGCWVYGCGVRILCSLCWCFVIGVAVLLASSCVVIVACAEVC